MLILLLFEDRWVSNKNKGSLKLEKAILRFLAEKNQGTAQLGPQKITGKSSEVGYPPLLAVLSIVFKDRIQFILGHSGQLGR